MDGLPAAATTDRPADAESAVAKRPADSHAELRLWLRLLTCTTMIEGDIRRRLRESFGVTLPRFDVMAQLAKEPGGLTLSEISRRMMVSNGNLTGLVERLVESGHVDRRPSPSDRRAQVVSLTPAGRAAFATMAAAHEGWVADLFRELGRGGIDDLTTLLGRAKSSVRHACERTKP